MIKDDSRFVYLYTSTKNGTDIPVYVGRGTAERTTDHGEDDDNPKLAAIIATGEYAVEVMECPDAPSAEMVEGALISAMRGRTKVALVNGRRDKHEFAPLGVPIALADRRTLPGLTPTEIAKHVGGRVLLVRNGPKKLNDPSRGVINPARPDPDAVADRVRRKWQIGGWVDHWIGGPEKAPLCIVGVGGTKHRYVVGSLDVSTLDWSTVEREGADVSIPAEPDDASLDGFGLRGRTVLDGVVFGQLYHKLFRLYDSTGPLPGP